MRIAYLATADARGHLMRAQLLTRTLEERGIEVRLVTTSIAGQQFLSKYGYQTEILSHHYAVQFDNQQNMLREATDANVASYLFHPKKMASDLLKLRRIFHDSDLVINDSFHPALLFMGSLPGYRRKVVHIYGASLRMALVNNFEGRQLQLISALFKRAVDFQINRARMRLEHDFAYPLEANAAAGCTQLPTPVEVAQPTKRANESPQLRAAVYLNPHFSDAALATALEQGLTEAGMSANLIGEGMAARSGWVSQDTNWVSDAASASLIISAPGMAALSVAYVYEQPIVLLLTDQPEQVKNAERAKKLGLLHRIVIWNNDTERFTQDLREACTDLCSQKNTNKSDFSQGYLKATQRLNIWADTIIALK